MIIHLDTKKRKALEIMIPDTLLCYDVYRKKLFHTVDTFTGDDQMAIYLYYYWDLSINEIAEMIHYSHSTIFCLLLIFKERMLKKLELFKNAAIVNSENMVSIKELFEIEVEEFMSGMSSYDELNGVSYDNVRQFQKKKDCIFEKILEKIHAEEMDNSTKIREN